MKKLLIITLLLTSQVIFPAVTSADVLKEKSNIFCDMLNYNNSLDKRADNALIRDSSNLLIEIQKMMESLDDIASIQKKRADKVLLISDDEYIRVIPTSDEEYRIINKHILNLNFIRKMVLQIRNTYHISHSLYNVLDEYKNSIDYHYYKLNPSYEAYALKQYNVSLKAAAQALMYAVGAFVGLSSGNAILTKEVAKNDIGCLDYTDLGIGLTASTLGAFLAYQAYMTVNNPSYEFELILQNK